MGVAAGGGFEVKRGVEGPDEGEESLDGVRTDFRSSRVCGTDGGMVLSVVIVLPLCRGRI